MAIEIISKKTNNNSSSLVNIVFYFAIFLLIAVILSYFGIRYFDGKTAEKHIEVQRQITEKETPDIREKEKQIIAYRDRMNYYFGALDKHVTVSNIFSFLERLIHPQIVFSWFSLEEKDAMLSLSGTADSFTSLGQQIILFEGDKSTASVILKKVSLLKEGGVDFQVDIIFDPKIFTNWPNQETSDKQ